jgi:GNAT superfamily N-acetyltransferase
MPGTISEQPAAGPWVRRLADGREVHLRLATPRDILPIVEGRVAAWTDLGQAEQAYCGYYRLKAYIYIIAPGAGIVTGWVEGRLAGFTFYAARPAQVRRTTTSGRVLLWAAGQAISGKLGGPLAWWQCLRWGSRHRDPSAASAVVEGHGPAMQLSTMPRGLVATVQTDVDFRRLGVGTALIDVAELLIQAEGVQEVALLVATDNKAAIRLYEKRGYQAAGLGRQGGKDVFVMWKHLGATSGRNESHP